MADKVWWGFSTTNEGDWGTAANWQPSGVPVSTDTVFIPAGTSAISGSLDQSAVLLAGMYVELGYDQPVGLFAGASPIYLQIDSNSLFWAGTGASYVEVRNGGGSLDVHVEAAGVQALTGIYQLYLTTDGSSTIGTLSVRSGAVALGAFGDDPAQTAANVRATGPNARVLVGDPVTATNLHVDQGAMRSVSAQTHALVEVAGGSCVTAGAGAITTATVDGGELRLQGGGTVTAATVDSGGILTATDGDSRTITTLTVHGGTAWIDPDTTTLTNAIAGRSDVPYAVSVKKA